jgi:hypothetical protein
MCATICLVDMAEVAARGELFNSEAFRDQAGRLREQAIDRR